MRKFRPKHWQKFAPWKRLYWTTRHELFVRKSCLRSCRQHLNTIQKSTVQTSCPQHRQWSAFKKRPKLNARQNVIVEKCYSKHRYKSLSIGTLMEMLVKTYQSQKLPKKPPKHTFKKKAVLKLSSESTMRRCRPKHWQKFASWKRLHWPTRQELFVRKSCLRRRRQHLNTLQKSTVQKSCPQHRQWSAI